MATTEKRTSQHTPGPWTYHEKDNRGWHSIRSSDYRTVAEIICQLPSETEANARLIAAAPEMLRLLVRFSNVFAPDATGRPHPDLLNTKAWRLTLLEVRALLARIEDRA